MRHHPAGAIRNPPGAFMPVLPPRRPYAPALTLCVAFAATFAFSLLLLDNPSPTTTNPTTSGAAPTDFLVNPYLQLPTPDGITVLWETASKLPGRVEYDPTEALGSTVEQPRATQLHEIGLPRLKPGTTYYYRVRSADQVSSVYSFKSAPPLGTKKWRLAVYGDSRSNPATHAKVAEAIRKANVDLIVHTGDIVTNGKDHDSWRKQFFEPLGDLARSTPWVSTIGNHEADSENYFSYMALPGNERYFAFNFANADIVCLDSNAWIAKGRDSAQVKWLTEHLAAKRDATWTFVAFHHPLFSAHATRPIIPLRWDWAPIFLDPANGVDGVLTGHDHFYARNYRMGRLAAGPQPGVLFLTSAGGGAPLYPCREFDYVAREKSVNHFTLFEFDGDRISVSAHDIAGNEIDRFELTKKPTPPDDFCCYEVEELRRLLREGLVHGPAAVLNNNGPTTIDASLTIPIRFAVPVAGELQWEAVDGWKMKQTTPFKLEARQSLTLPLQAEVPAGTLDHNPKLTIAFEKGRFRNRTVEVFPFQLRGPDRVAVGPAQSAPMIDGKLDDRAWQNVAALSLLGLPPRGGRADQVRLLAGRELFFLGAALDDAAEVKVTEPQGDPEVGALVLREPHCRLELSDGATYHNFVLTPDQHRYHGFKGSDSNAKVEWLAAAASTKAGWSAEMAVPRRLFADWSKVRINVTHRRKVDGQFQDLQLCPSYTHLMNGERIPEVLTSDTTEAFAWIEMK
jgi:acid phosphatase type 7